ncbi:MAG TPA: glycosyltransferase N-terminal domain-containing protein [Chthoniobacterales bacterium]|nr:glycosyltransferase N-terminal domain-containing protein [Chthoniobacterales bacterium]
MLLLLYNLFLPFALLLSLPFYLRRMLKRGGYARNFFQRFGFFSAALREQIGSQDWTWIRAVSVGEMLLALRLAAELRRQDPEFRAVISTTTSTGYQLGLDRADRNYLRIIYSPVDSYPILQRVWRLIRPIRVILIDSDLWPGFLAIAGHKGVPVFLANARLSSRSEKRYSRLQWLAKRLFWKRLTAVFAQDTKDAERWERLGLPTERITVTGSIKYDRAGTVSERNLRFIEWLKKRGIASDRPILLGGSLHSGEEELLIQAFLKLRPKHPALFLILVPRHAERAPEIAELLQKESLPFARRTDSRFSPETAVLLVDSTGELRDWYETAGVVVIGKSFCGIGGQNPVEPLLAHKPVVCGPHMENFRFLVEELVAENGIKQLRSDQDLIPAVDQLLADPAAANRMAKRAETVLAQHDDATARSARLVLHWKDNREWIRPR